MLSTKDVDMVEVMSHGEGGDKRERLALKLGQ